jgi:hypothetical protein
MNCPSNKLALYCFCFQYHRQLQITHKSCYIHLRTYNLAQIYKELESHHLCLPKGTLQVLVSHFLGSRGCSTRWRQRRPTTLSWKSFLPLLVDAWCGRSTHCLLGRRTNREALWLSSSNSGTCSHGRWQEERGRRQGRRCDVLPRLLGFRRSDDGVPSGRRGVRIGQTD